MSQKEIVEAFIIISAWSIYLHLVTIRVAHVEGFVALTVYIVKKFLDMLEIKRGEDDTKTTQSPGQ